MKEKTSKETARPFVVHLVKAKGNSVVLRMKTHEHPSVIRISRDRPTSFSYHRSEFLLFVLVFCLMFSIIKGGSTTDVWPPRLHGVVTWGLHVVLSGISIRFGACTKQHHVPFEAQNGSLKGQGRALCISLAVLAVLDFSRRVA